MDFHGNIDLLYNNINNMVFEQEPDFPQVPIVGRVVFKGQILYMCVALNSGVPIWIPLTNKISTYVHTQSVASSSWTITHNLNVVTPIIQVYDSAGSMLIPNTVTPNSNNEMVVDLGTANTGTVIVLFGSLMPTAGVGILEPDIVYGSLIGHFKFDETFGTTAIEEISGKDGDLINGVQINQPSQNGIGYTFDGTNDFITAGNNFDFDRTDPFSLAMWIKPSTVTTTHFIASKAQSSGIFRGYDFRIQNPGVLGMNMTSTSGVNQIVIKTPDNTIVSGVWQHIVMTYDGSSDSSGISIYVDGTIVSGLIVVSNFLSATMSQANPFNIGTRNSQGIFSFTGSMDDFRIYDEALNAGQVLNLFTDTQ
jgi:hypothetical protein